MTIINSIIKGGGSAPAHYIEKAVDANGRLLNGTTVINLTGVTDIADYALYEAYYSNRNVSGGIDLSSLIEMSGVSACQSMFYTSLSITSVDLKNLVKISGNQAGQNMFAGCTGITSVDLSSLTFVTGNSGANGMLRECTKLTTLDLGKLAVVTGLNSCTNFNFASNHLTSVDLSSLYEVTGNSCFTNFLRNCTAMSEISFPAITTTSFGTSYINQFQNFCSGITGITMHFPSNVQSVIEGLTGYSSTAPFGATSGAVLFDLPATVILTGANGVEYQRNPKYDTSTALAWRVKDTGTLPNITIDWTPFYTSGLTDPTVGTTIYSDDACTTVVTTVDSIA